MKDANTNNGSDAMFSEENIRFARLITDSVGFEGIQTFANYVLNDIEKMERLQIEAVEQFKCRRCGDCCKTCDTELTDDDIIRLCKHLDIKFDEFYDHFMNHIHINNYLLSPCPFLNDEGCEVYDVRPGICRAYPFAGNTLTMHPCKLGHEIWEILIKIFGKASPTENGTKKTDMLVSTRDFMIDAGRDNTICNDGSRTTYIFVNISQVKAILKYI